MKDKVVLELVLGSMVDEIDPWVDLLIADLRVVGNVNDPILMSFPPK